MKTDKSSNFSRTCGSTQIMGFGYDATQTVGLEILESKLKNYVFCINTKTNCNCFHVE